MKIKCEFCNELINSRGICAHLLKKHNKTVEDNTLARIGKTKADIPACRFCGKPVKVTVHGFLEICSSSECKAKLTHLHKSESVSKQMIKLAKSGKHPFQSKNLVRDADGKSIRHRKLAEAQVALGKNPLQKRNRPKAENGKDLYVHNANIQRALGHAKNTELFTKDYLESHFVKDNRFLIGDCMRFFNYSYPTVNRSKIACGINAPNKHGGLGAQQKQIADYIRSIYSGPIIENSHNIIQPLELDIYLPEKKLAIEFDGLMYHSMGTKFPVQTDNRLKTYHLKKTELCKDQGIQLLHIFENEWQTKQEIWKSVIRAKLGVVDRKIFARVCTVREIQGPTEFLAANHLQGAAPAAITLGLYFKDELVSVMSFGKPRYTKNATWELLRFCNLKNTRVLGGASKLLKQFRASHVGSIVSYANRRWSDGELYKKLGFALVGESKPSYYYFKPDDFVIHHRSQFQKHKLSGVLETFDPKASETENMLNNGYRKIYDCGTFVFFCD